ncbi:MAG: hypothetical protein AB2689_25740 [Candidatus Thiodiazotropha taylori]|nr:hypothetical protein [Candidatus Thiodiazotropha taylori]MCW4315765.1 hypothetical protein [Candidatus Thiodiazotropha taylori]
MIFKTIIALCIFIMVKTSFASTDVNLFQSSYLSEYFNTNIATLEFEAFSEKKIGKLLTKFSDGNNLYSLSAQGIIDEDSKSGNFADLDGLKDGSKITFGYSRVLFDKKKVYKLANASIESCKKEIAEKIMAAHTEVLICRMRNQSDANMLNSEDEKEALFATRCNAEYKKERAIPSQCSDYNGYDDLVEESINSEDGFSTHRIGIELSGGSNRFKWIDPVSLVSNKKTKSSYSMELQYGYISSRFQRYNLGFRYEDKWKGSKSISLCTPNAINPNTMTCQMTPIEPPNNTVSRILYFEWKSYFGSNDNKAANIRLSHDLKTDLTGIDIPIYLYQVRKNRDLQGGIRIGWISDSDTSDDKKNDPDTIFSVFFNKSFRIN